jgi:signal transduction histidine kinase
MFQKGYSTGQHGTGLGLTIVEKISVAHGWDISITDGTEGGARFEISGVKQVNKKEGQ